MDIAGLKIGADFGTSSGSSNTTQNTTTAGTQVVQKNLSQAAIDKLIYDALSADSGLAALATGENLSGGYGASTKALLAQDFMTKLIGELANVTAATTTTTSGTQETDSQTSQKTKKSGLKTVICSHLFKQGLFPASLYHSQEAFDHYHSLHPFVITGYHTWAIPFVRLMERYPALNAPMARLCKSRYRQVVHGKITLGGAITIYLGHPICFLIGAVRSILVKEKSNGYVG